MTGKDTAGRFTPGNGYAALGGRRRAERLTPERRREIARAGWLAFVAKYHHGDVRQAARAIAQAGNVADTIYYGHSQGRVTP